MIDRSISEALIAKGREFMKGYHDDTPYLAEYESDQDLKLPQPPLVKAPMADESARTSLPMDFEHLSTKNDLLALIRDRKSNRIYTEQPLSLLQFSFLLWATQGIKSIRGKKYATLRTVPCGGARHQYETYLLIRNVEGLQPGAYHYLPMEHAIEFLHPVEGLEKAITDSLSGQRWAEKAAAVFYWAMDAYRVEWRYGIYAHRVALIDAGHVGQNLYLACTGLGIGTCGIAAFRHDICNEIFGLDGNDEYVVYTAPVGAIRPEDIKEEQAFYKFVEEQDL